MRRHALVPLAVVACLGAPTAAARAEAPADVNWPQLLAAMPTPAGHSGGPHPGCPKARLACVTEVMARLRRVRDGFGCDHRGVFATTYLELTRVLRQVMRGDPRFFQDRQALIFEDVLFARVYFRTLRREARGRPVDEAWRIAFDAGAGDLGAAGDMLLGINAHVQNDMPFVLAAITLRDRRGRSRKPDHDRMNAVLDRAFQPVVREVARRYDPFAATQTYQLSPVTDVAGNELVRSWREGVWRNAERLTNARSDAERRRVAEGIRAQAAASARLIEAAAQGPPGHRARRDAHCASSG